MPLKGQMVVNMMVVKNGWYDGGEDMMVVKSGWYDGGEDLMKGLKNIYLRNN